MVDSSPAPLPDPSTLHRPAPGWRLRLYRVVFETDTRTGRLFDVVLVILILMSVVVVMLDSVPSLHARFRLPFQVLEWAFTLVFTIEYILRLVCVKRPWRYARSMFGVIDLLAVLPTYVAILVPGMAALIDVRVLRLLRIFRIFKLGAYVAEYSALREALAASRRKILVFMTFVLMVTVVIGTLMYVVEGPEHGYTTIPVGVYWAITTMTTVGFGDIAPQTNLGRAIASLMMLLGWGTLAVPTGIVSSELTAQRRAQAGAMSMFTPRPANTRRCPECLSEGHATQARFCSDCGARLSG